MVYVLGCKLFDHLRKRRGKKGASFLKDKNYLLFGKGRPKNKKPAGYLLRLVFKL